MDLNMYFNSAIDRAMHFNTHDFQFDAMPFYSTQSMVTTVLVYFSVIFGLQSMMKNLSPIRINSIFFIHNALLSFVSLALLALMVPMIAADISKNGLFHAVCGQSMGYNNHLNFLYYINYMMKVWELADTVFLVLRKKKLEFLHVYHHSLTFLLCGVQLRGATAVQWVPITINLGIHVIMYYYYANAAAGIRIWWKKYLTVGQITQFVVDIVFIYYSAYMLMTSPGSCQMTPFSGYFGMWAITSYLALFVQFYAKTYKAKNCPSEKKQL
ncbi:ELO family [Globomyces pollinis-pini]|nr:ELO family [Globomyces pollinis-pini]